MKQIINYYLKVDHLRINWNCQLRGHQLARITIGHGMQKVPKYLIGDT